MVADQIFVKMFYSSELLDELVMILPSGISNGGSENLNNGRPVTAKGEFVRTLGPIVPKTPQNGTRDGGIELTELTEAERGHTPSPTKTQGSEVSIGLNG